MPSFFRFFLASAFLFILDASPCLPEVLESQVKTAYVLNFIKFTEWPAGAPADSKMTLCVVGNNVLDGMLASLDGRKTGDQEIHVAKFHADALLAANKNSIGILGSCQAMYIGKSEQRRFISIIKSLGDAPILTISDIEDFAEYGGNIGLDYQENKIVFEVNLGSVQKSGLRLPGQLLNLASNIFRR